MEVEDRKLGRDEVPRPVPLNPASRGPHSRVVLDPVTLLKRDQEGVDPPLPVADLELDPGHRLNRLVKRQVESIRFVVEGMVVGDEAVDRDEAGAPIERRRNSRAICLDELSVVATLEENVLEQLDLMPLLQAMLLPAAVDGPRPSEPIQKDAIAVAVGMEEYGLAAPPTLDRAGERMTEGLQSPGAKLLSSDGGSGPSPWRRHAL